MGAEKSFEEKLKSWLETQGIYPLGTPAQDIHVKPCGYWEKRWGGGKYIKSGMPDMHIVVNGISIEVELKAPGNKPSELQKQKLNQIDDSGCIAVVLYPEDFQKFKSLIVYFKHCPVHNPSLVEYMGLKRGWRE